MVNRDGRGVSGRQRDREGQRRDIVVLKKERNQEVS